MTKAGGVLIIALAVAATTTPSIPVTALVGALPLLAGMVILAWAGPETRRRRLEEITRSQFARQDERDLIPVPEHAQS
jgi:putative MFS transporter